MTPERAGYPYEVTLEMVHEASVNVIVKQLMQTCGLRGDRLSLSEACRRAQWRKLLKVCAEKA